MTRSSFRVLFVLAVMVWVSACSSLPPTTAPSSVTESPISPLPSPAATQTAHSLPVPEPGKAAVGGEIFSYTGNGPVPGTFLYLYALQQGTTDIPAVLGSARTEQGDISGKTDEQGRFVLNNVPPGDYYLAIWAPLTWLIIPRSRSDETPRLISVKADERVDLGRLELAWP